MNDPIEILKESIILDPNRPSAFRERLKAKFRTYVVSQELAIDKLVRQVAFSYCLGGNLRDREKPRGIFLYLGPTGSGKTLIPRTLARLLFGSFDALTIINCSEYSERHQVSRLIGAPKGYLGHDSAPQLTQSNIDSWGYKNFLEKNQDLFTKQETNKVKIKSLNAVLRKEPAKKSDVKEEIRVLQEENDKISRQLELRPGSYVNIIVFDEFEKAHRSLQNLLLPVLDRGTMTIDSKQVTEQVFFRNSFLFFTSNLGQEIIGKETGTKKLAGFVSPKYSESAQQRRLYHLVKNSLPTFFSEEFISRVTERHTVIFNLLTRADIREALDRIYIPRLQSKYSTRAHIEIDIDEMAREYIVRESHDNKGMRSLGGYLEDKVDIPISNLLERSLADQGLTGGDRLLITTDPQGQYLLFMVVGRKPQTVIIPMK